MKKPFLIIVTGLSGSGKSTVMKTMEDAGFFCMDNIPLDILLKLIEIKDFDSIEASRICIGVDVRGGALSFVKNAPELIKRLRGKMDGLKLIFIEADQQSLLNRFKETRRRHPLSETYPNLVDAIEAEWRLMAPVRELSDLVINTAGLNVHQLARRVEVFLSEVSQVREMHIEVCSFGFKFGIPTDADIVMDVRFLPNPFFIPELKDKTGCDQDVKEFLAAQESYASFIASFNSLIAMILPQYKAEGRVYLKIAIGCTGGRHRSVAVAESLNEHINSIGFSTQLSHRDLS